MKPYKHTTGEYVAEFKENDPGQALMRGKEKDRNNIG